MRRIIDYQIVIGTNASDLEGRVKSYMQKSWQPLGGILAGSVFAQAIVKYEQYDL